MQLSLTEEAFYHKPFNKVQRTWDASGSVVIFT